MISSLILTVFCNTVNLNSLLVENENAVVRAVTKTKPENKAACDVGW